jgi:lantibiotic modifying enzyme
MTEQSKLLALSTLLTKGMLANPEFVNPHMGHKITNEEMVKKAVDIAQLLIGEVNERVKA